MTKVALLVYVVALVLAFGLRTVQQLRRTGRTGWVGVARGVGAARWGAVLFAGSLILGIAGVALAAGGALAVAVVPGWLGALGVLVAVVGAGVVLASQSAMGDQWRIGVDPSERTGLVTGGVFWVARNPIFTGMILTQLGVLMMTPSWLTGLSLLLLIAGIELQVRGVEEPYLTRIHGQRYQNYRAQVGRFVPGVGH